jgi:hypothetical protein
MAPGYLTVPDTVIPGYYRILSYTSLMQNFDPKFCYSSWIRVDELNQKAVNAVFSFDKESYSLNDTAEVEIRLTDELRDTLKNKDFTYTLLTKGTPGDYYRVRTNSQGVSVLDIVVSDSIYENDDSIEINIQNKKFTARKSIPKKSDQIELRFLPEGGTFTYGIKQRLAFNAASKDGRQLYVSGIVKNNLGKFVDSIRSGELGPGILDFTPLSGQNYYAEIEGYPDSRFDLPQPTEAMPVLRADYGDKSVIVRVWSPDADSRNDYLVFRKNNKVLAFQEIDSTFRAFRFDTGILPQGTASFLILDNNMNPVAERMVFINPDKEVNVNIIPSKEVYQPAQETEISFSVEDSSGAYQAGVFSVAVVDSVTGFYPILLSPNIEETFLFDQQFYNNLPEHVKFQGLSDATQENMDILLLTYGWKKFTWEPASEKNKEAERIYYDMLKVMIDDNLTKRQDRKLKELENLFYLMSLEDSRIFEMAQIDNKSFYFLFDSLGIDANNVMVTTADTAVRYVTSASVNLPVNQDYYQSVFSLFSEPILNSKEEYSIIPDYQIITNRTMLIEEVSITESRRKAPEYVNEYEKEYKNFSTVTLDKDDMEAAFDLESLIRMLHPYKIIPDPYEPNVLYVYLRRVFHSLGSPRLEAALFVVDGFPIGNSTKKLYFLKPDEIHSVTALRGPFGHYRYGPKAVGGVIFIETKHNNVGGEYEYEEPLPDRGDLGRVINLFRPNIEFYTPDVKDVSEYPDNWTRPTLYWNPEIILDGTNPVRIKYPNHIKKGTVLIKVNGVTEDSRPFYGECRYEIK